MKKVALQQFCEIDYSIILSSMIYSVTYQHNVNSNSQKRKGNNNKTATTNNNHNSNNCDFAIACFKMFHNSILLWLCFSINIYN